MDSNEDAAYTRAETFWSAFGSALVKGTIAILPLWGVAWVVTAFSSDVWHKRINTATGGVLELSGDGLLFYMSYSGLIGIWTWLSFRNASDEQTCGSCGAEYSVSTEVIERKQISRIARERASILTDAEDRNKVVRFVETTYEDTIKTSCKACGLVSIGKDYETVEEDSDEATVWASHMSNRIPK